MVNTPHKQYCQCEQNNGEALLNNYTLESTIKIFSNEISLLIYICLWLSIAAILFLQESSNSWSGIVARSTSTIHRYNQSVIDCFIGQ